VSKKWKAHFAEQKASVWADINASSMGTFGCWCLSQPSITFPQLLWQLRIQLSFFPLLSWGRPCSATGTLQTYVSQDGRGQLINPL